MDAMDENAINGALRNGRKSRRAFTSHECVCVCYPGGITILPNVSLATILLLHCNASLGAGRGMIF